MKNVILKVTIVLLLATMILVSLHQYVNAATISTEEGEFTPEEMNAKIDSRAKLINPSRMFKNAKDNTGTSGTATNILGAIITITQIIGVGVAIIMLIVLAIKYISSAPGDKAEIKKHAVVYIVGATVLFAASGILGIIKNFSQMFTEKGM